jgi:hypothetical protein
VVLDTPTLPALTLAHPPPRTRGSTNLLSFPDLHICLSVVVCKVHELLVRTVMHTTDCVLLDAEVSFHLVEGNASIHTLGPMYRKEKSGKAREGEFPVCKSIVFILTTSRFPFSVSRHY